MKKVWALLVLLAVVALSPCVSEGAGRYLKIGSDPVAPKEFNSQTEELYRTRGEVYVEITSKSGKVSKGLLEPGTILVISPSNWKALRVYECGNLILNEVYIKPRRVDLYAVNKVAVAPAPTPTSGIEENIRRQVREERTRRGIIGGSSQKCFGVGTLETFLGASGVSFGVASDNPLVAGVSAVVMLIGVFNDDSSAGCKALSALAGGVGGYLTGNPSKKSGNNSESGGNNSSGSSGGNNGSGGSGGGDSSGSGSSGGDSGSGSVPNGPGPDPLP